MQGKWLSNAKHTSMPPHSTHCWRPLWYQPQFLHYVNHCNASTSNRLHCFRNLDEPQIFTNVNDKKFHLPTIPIRGAVKICLCRFSIDFFFFFFFFETEGRQANAKHRRQLTTWQVFCQVERRFHSRDSNRQSLPWDLGIPLPSPGSLRPSRTRFSIDSYWSNFSGLIRRH